MRSVLYTHNAVQLFGYIGVVAGSMLIMLRTYVFRALRLSSWGSTLMDTTRIAIWDRHKIVFALAMCAWLINVASLLRSKSVLLMARN